MSPASGYSVRPLVAADADAFHALRKEALTAAPDAFGASPEDDRFADGGGLSELCRRGDGSVVIGGFMEGLRGSVGLAMDAKLKTRHKAHVWGLYVAPAARRSGMARALMEALISHARALDGVTDLQLCVSNRADAARVLYESLGFRVWGTEPRAMQLEGLSVELLHMDLALG